MPTTEREFSNTRIFADGENSSFENGQENAQARSGCGYAFESTVSATEAFEEQPNTNGNFSYTGNYSITFNRTQGG